MNVLAVVACFMPDSAFLVHFYFAVEDEHSDSGLVVRLAVLAAVVVWPDSRLVVDSK